MSFCMHKFTRPSVIMWQMERYEFETQLNYLGDMDKLH